MNPNDSIINTDEAVTIINLPGPRPGMVIKIRAQDNPILVVPPVGTSFRNASSWRLQGHSARYYRKSRGRARWRARKKESSISYQMGPDGLTIQY